MRTCERLWAIVWKEWLQVFRDPSALLIAFVFPAVMLFLFGYGLSLDATNVRIGVVLEDDAPLARSFYRSLNASRYFDVRYYSSRMEAERALRDEETRAAVVDADSYAHFSAIGGLGGADLSYGHMLSVIEKLEAIKNEPGAHDTLWLMND